MVLQRDAIWKTRNLSTGKAHPGEGGTAWETQNSSAFVFILANPVIGMPTQSQ